MYVRVGWRVGGQLVRMGLARYRGLSRGLLLLHLQLSLLHFLQQLLRSLYPRWFGRGRLFGLVGLIRILLGSFLRRVLLVRLCLNIGSILWHRRVWRLIYPRLARLRIQSRRI